MQKPPKLVPKIILEGTRLTHKTDIAFALNRHPRIVGPRRYEYHNPLISAEWCAFTNYPWGRGLINFAPEERGRAVETYDTWVRLFELQKYYSWIIDRFHISTIVVQRELYGTEIDFSRLEERLAALRFCVIFCYRRPETFEAARRQRCAVSGNPRQYDDISVFLREQEAFAREIERSRLPSLTVDVSDNDVAGISETIADWMEAKALLGYSEPERTC